MMTVASGDSTIYGRQYSCPTLTEDDSFLSATKHGFIVYRIPAVHKIMQVSEAALATFDTLDMTVQVYSALPEGGEVLKCSGGWGNRCRIRFKRSVTPVIYYMNPPVVYQDAEINLSFDSKAVANVISELASDEMPFINFKIGGS